MGAPNSFLPLAPSNLGTPLRLQTLAHGCIQALNSNESNIHSRVGTVDQRTLTVLRKS